MLNARASLAKRIVAVCAKALDQSVPASSILQNAGIRSKDRARRLLDEQQRRLAIKRWRYQD